MLIPLDNKSFVKQEFENLNLNDARLNERALKVCEMINANPSLSFPNASRGNKDELKAFYRFFQNKNVTDQNVLQTHYKNTILRCFESKCPIFLITDSIYMSPAKYKSMDGLKDLGKGKKNGLRMHYMIAVNANTGDVLGITDLRIIRDEITKTNITLKDESDIWKLVAQATVKNIKNLLPEKDAEKLISACTYIADREGDDYDLFLCLESLDLHYIIRSQYDRKMGDENSEEKLKISEFEEDEIKHAEPYEITVQEKDGGKRSALVQRSVLKNCTIYPPADQSEKEPIKVCIVFVREIDPPPGKEQVNWKLLTSHPVKNSKDSEGIVSAYKARWKIEELNKCAKSGVLLEKRQFKDLDRLLPAISIIFVVAWRILYIRDIGKNKEDTSIQEVFSKEEVAYLNDKLSPEEGKYLTVTDAMGYIAKEGGFLGYYDNPGWIILWRGWFKFVLLVEGYTFGKKGKKRKKE